RSAFRVNGRCLSEPAGARSPRIADITKDIGDVPKPAHRGAGRRVSLRSVPVSTQPVQTLTPGISSEAAALRDTRAQRYTQLLLLVVAAGAIYPILYLRQVYQPTMLEVFHINE